jgi:hypothetical protein
MPTSKRLLLGGVNGMSVGVPRRALGNANNRKNSRLRSRRGHSGVAWNTGDRERVVSSALIDQGGHYAFQTVGDCQRECFDDGRYGCVGSKQHGRKMPGHIMQRTPQVKSTGPGASEYAPGHLKRKSKSQSASKFTPSHRRSPTTTGMRTR